MFFPRHRFFLRFIAAFLRRIYSYIIIRKLSDRYFRFTATDKIKGVTYILRRDLHTKRNDSRYSMDRDLGSQRGRTGGIYASPRALCFSQKSLAILFFAAIKDRATLLYYASPEKLARNRFTASFSFEK